MAEEDLPKVYLMTERTRLRLQLQGQEPDGEIVTSPFVPDGQVYTRYDKTAAEVREEIAASLAALEVAQRS